MEKHTLTVSELADLLKIIDLRGSEEITTDRVEKAIGEIKGLRINYDSPAFAEVVEAYETGERVDVTNMPRDEIKARFFKV